MTTYTIFQPEHLPAIVELCKAQGYTSYSTNPQKTRRALTAPGVITLIALNSHHVIGFAQLQTDSEIQAHLSLIVVHPDFRKQGIGRGLLQEAFKHIGVKRIDLITEDAQTFYRSRPHKEWSGFRIYPPDDIEY